MKRLAPLLLALCSLGVQAASYLTPEAAINKAGRQRMMAELIVKEYIQIAEGVSVPGARGHLDDAVTVFDDQLADLKDFTTDAQARAAVAELERRWQEVRAIVTAPPSRSGISSLRVSALALHEAAERNVAELERLQGRPTGRVIALSGRQRMLCQRIAKDYLLIAGRIDADSSRQELQRSQEEFEAAQRELAAAASNDELRAELAAVGTLWEELQPLLRRGRDTAANRSKVVELTDAILGRMERATLLFERNAKS